MDSPSSVDGEQSHPVIGTDSLNGFGITGCDSESLVRMCVCVCACVCMYVFIVCVCVCVCVCV